MRRRVSDKTACVQLDGPHETMVLILQSVLVCKLSRKVEKQANIAKMVWVSYAPEFPITSAKGLFVSCIKDIFIAHD